jgi:hypothetical protein
MALDDTPSMGELMLQAARTVLGAHWVSLPYVVKSFDTETQRVTLDPIHEDLPSVLAPVAFPAGANFQATWVLSPGDTGLLQIQSRTIWGWLDSGASVPESKRRGNLADGIFIPAAFQGLTHDETFIGTSEAFIKLWPDAIRIDVKNNTTIEMVEGRADISASQTSIGNSATFLEIVSNLAKLVGATIELGVAPLHNMAYGDEIASYLTLIRNTYNLHSHSNPGAPPSQLLGAVPDVQSNVAFVE